MTLFTGALPVVGGSPGRHAPRVAALGGGHGLSATLQALRHVSTDISAIVTVADDGGSSGRLRAEFGVLPPGDLRMALAALCDDTDWGHTWRDAMQHRFTPLPTAESALEGHALGNLLIISLWDLLGDPVAGLQWAGALLGARGRVLPMSRTPLVIEGDVLVDDGGRERREHVVGQSALGHAGRRQKIESVTVHPADAEACPEAVSAVREADWVIVGPGSWYTSVMPHVLLPSAKAALVGSSARKVLTMNLVAETKETPSMSAADHLVALRRVAPEATFDVVLVDPGVVEDTEAFETAARDMGARVKYARLGRADAPEAHDVLRLATAYREIFHEHEEQ
ncbi:uridine diphosphate-N-acetylglucosamine-binding protein YvcK [Falsarthrobacter nasiphocae]|uniref:Putative gluconeogenesis factor n=1 Tax=Falsarthrobacter nasiphocae TaxID=189863 RepID=A0AAE3YD17_9MICC|nr:uridine diphosphate-N-acetylglucosamine-binding protein YvcK [Falsarthrobacter nasiphocae]MDR6891164.1 putative cofD-like protein [Falsarthrobacter nasiphocae]